MSIELSSITNGSLNINQDWVGTGVFDVLMAAVNKNIEGQYIKGRITGADYAATYLGAIQSVLAQSVEFALREPLTDAQVSVAYTERIGKDKEVAAMGMDNVMKLREKSRVDDINYVYKPAYEKVL